MDKNNLSLLNNISCASISCTGDITCNSIISSAASTINFKNFTVSDKISQSSYYTFKGYSKYVVTDITRQYYTKYDGTPSTLLNIDFTVDSNCFCVKKFLQLM